MCIALDFLVDSRYSIRVDEAPAYIFRKALEAVFLIFVEWPGFSQIAVVLPSQEVCPNPLKEIPGNYREIQIGARVEYCGEFGHRG
jgi:hypothetical protein